MDGWGDPYLEKEGRKRGGGRMGFVKAGTHEYLLVGRGGKLENKGSAVQVYLRPGTVWARVPSAKQEVTFEFTQETKDGIPLRFKGIAVYRITDPIAAAAYFDFGQAGATDRITTLLAHICLGELRHAVSHMTMEECIEQRKTVLSGVVDSALRAAVDGPAGSWGVTVEVAQVAQVYIVDADLRRQLEAEVRNEIRQRSDLSDLQTKEQGILEAMASEGRVADQRLAEDREAIRREEELERARDESRRRGQVEDLEDQRLEISLAQELLRAQLEADREKLEIETPVLLLRAAREREVLAAEMSVKRLQLESTAIAVDRDLLRPRADHQMRMELLPVEQAPEIVKAAAKVFNGASLSVYGDDAGLIEHIAPVLDVISGAVRRATASPDAGPA